jgi:hypothetical protein
MDFDAKVDYLKSHKRLKRAKARYANREALICWPSSIFLGVCLLAMHLAY